VLSLDSVTSLSDKAAGALAQFRGAHLDFSNLSELSKAGQDALAGHSGDFFTRYSFWGGPAKFESTALAKKFIEGEGRKYLSLRNTVEVSPAVADVLIQYERLNLDNLRSLTHAGLARKLIAERGHLFGQWDLPELVVVSPEVARELVSSQGGDLKFQSLQELTPDVADELAKCQGSLHFGSLRSLSDEAAAALAKHEGGVSIPLLESLTNAKLAMNIERPAGALSRAPVLPKLRIVSDEVAVALVEAGRRSGPGGFSLDDFPSLTELTNKDFARQLFAHNATWQPNGGGHWPTNKLALISPEVAQVISECKRPGGWAVPLDGLRDLDAATAKALANYEGAILLGGLREITAQVAAELARHQGMRGGEFYSAQRSTKLYLDGLTTMSEEVARALSAHAGPVYLRRLQWDTLSDDKVSALRKRESIHVILSKAKRTGKIGRSTLEDLIEIYGREEWVFYY